MSDSSKDRTLERVQVVPLNQIDDFPDHPFLVKDDDSIQYAGSCGNGEAFGSGG